MGAFGNLVIGDSFIEARFKIVFNHGIFSKTSIDIVILSIQLMN